MVKKPKQPKRRANPTDNDCIIPPAIPVEALSGLTFERDGKSAEDIAAYVEDQSLGEKVKHSEKVMTQTVLGGKYECWDVRLAEACERFIAQTPGSDVGQQQ